MREMKKDTAREVTETLDTTIREGNKELKKKMSEETARILEEINTIPTKEIQKPTPLSTIETYAGKAKDPQHPRPQTLHSILITSKESMDTLDDVINKAKEILKPEETKTQIDRIRKVKDQY
ncbi:unnamed protein product [Diatraea saccharalis]|uniref:Uncharacterized protein n=1 Tax=Diatraea saccharalis TaxID=40085 RepID=A0A9N9R741_9NEOP|nr:unnamed protein product [Diatraea saccharalis]